MDARKSRDLMYILINMTQFNITINNITTFYFRCVSQNKLNHYNVDIGLALCELDKK